MRAAAFCLISLFSVGVFAADPEVEESEAIDDLEEIEEIEEVEGAEAGEGDSLPKLISKFHAAVVHFPIAWLVLLLGLDLLTYVFGQEHLKSAGFLVLLGAFLSMVPSSFTGLLHLREMTTNDPEILQPVLDHRNVMFAVTAMLVVAVILRAPVREKLEGARQYAYLGFIFVANALVLWGGHLGGILVYGENYLPF